MEMHLNAVLAALGSRDRCVQTVIIMIVLPKLNYFIIRKDPGHNHRPNPKATAPQTSRPTTWAEALLQAHAPSTHRLHLRCTRCDTAAARRQHTNQRSRTTLHTHEVVEADAGRVRESVGEQSQRVAALHVEQGHGATVGVEDVAARADRADREATAATRPIGGAEVKRPEAASKATTFNTVGRVLNDELTGRHR